jgi:hypothetical protein
MAGKQNYQIDVEMLMTFTKTMSSNQVEVETLKALMKQFNLPIPIPTFSDLDREDPKKFLDLCKEKPLSMVRQNRSTIPVCSSLVVKEQHHVRIIPPRAGKRLRPQVVGHRGQNEARHRVLRKETSHQRASRHLRCKKNTAIHGRKIQRYIKSSLDEGRPKFSTNDVVPPASFVGVPAPRHHERPHQPPDQVQERDQKLVDRQDPDEPRFDEEDALRETTTGDAAGVPPQDAGGLRHAQDAHRGRCAQPLLERERGEATSASARPEHLPVESADQKGDDGFEIITAESSVEQHLQRGDLLGAFDSPSNRARTYRGPRI